MNTLFVLLLVAFLAMGLYSCKKDDTSDPACENTFCTEQYVSFQVVIKDQNQMSVALDAFEVMDLDNDADYTITLSNAAFEAAQQSGIYPLVEDLQLQTIGFNKERRIRFRGFINSRQVIQADNVVQTDCCHIDITSGNLELTL